VSRPFSTAVNHGLLAGRRPSIAVSILFSIAVNYGSLFGRRLNNAVSMSHFGRIAISRLSSTALEQVFGRAYRNEGTDMEITIAQC
jgi:hypothetical protein